MMLVPFDLNLQGNQKIKDFRPPIECNTVTHIQACIQVGRALECMQVCAQTHIQIASQWKTSQVGRTENTVTSNHIEPQMNANKI